MDNNDRRIRRVARQIIRARRLGIRSEELSALDLLDSLVPDIDERLMVLAAARADLDLMWGAAWA